MTATSTSTMSDRLSGQRVDHVVLALLVAGAAALRLLYLGQPMRNDEAYSYLYFALPSLRTAVSDYTLPNNHVFHTVLVWAATRLFGTSPEAIRLPVLIAGVLAVPSAWLAARSLADRRAGLFAAAAVAALPALALYSTNARGYMLIGLATLLLVWLGVRLLDAERLWQWAAIVIIGALGMWTAPVMLYPLGAVSLWLLVEHVRTQGARGAAPFAVRLAVAMALIAALTALLYLPVIVHAGAASLTQNRFVKPLTLPAMAGQAESFLRGMRELIGLGLSRIEVVLALVVASLGIAAPGEHRARRVTLALTTAIWCSALVLITRRPPPPRVLLFLAPLLCLYLGIGLSWLVARAKLDRPPVSAFAALLLFAVIAVQVVRTRAVLESEETDWIGIRDARAVAELVAAGRGDERIVINRSSGPPVDYYLYHITGQRLSHFTDAQRRGPILLVLDERHHQTTERVLPLHPDVPWSTLGAPRLLKRFPGVSVYAYSAATP